MTISLVLIAIWSGDQLQKILLGYMLVDPLFARKETIRNGNRNLYRHEACHWN